MPRRPSLTALQSSIERLMPADQQPLYDWLGQQLHEREIQYYDGKTYVLQKRRCNKEGCFCMDGEVAIVGHGPYWYAYWNDGGKTQSKYVGKRPPWQKY